MLSKLSFGLNGLLDEGDLMFVGRYTQTSTGQSLTISGLGGNTHRHYLLKGRVIVPSATANVLSLQPNGLTSNQTSEQSEQFGAVTKDTIWRVADVGVGDTGTPLMMVDFTCEIMAGATINGTACYRSYCCTAWLSGDATDRETVVWSTTGIWDETSTELTSIVLYSSDASGIEADSEVLVFTPNNTFGA